MMAKVLNKWLQRWHQQTSYPDLQLTDKQNELISRVDEHLVAAHQGKAVFGQMIIHMTGVPFMSTIFSVDKMMQNLHFEYGTSYIPRSVAFHVDSSGNWILTYAVRAEEGSDAVTTSLFTELLNKTNNARS